MAQLAHLAPEVPAANLPETIAFYEGLGFSLTRYAQPDYAIIERDGIALHLFEDKLRRSTPAAFHLFTPDLAGLFEEFAGREVPLTQGIERKPWGNRDFRPKDPFGNELKFTEALADGE